MINRLPKWVEAGGFLLALNAGFINAVGVLGLAHQVVSHLTGVSTFLSVEIVSANTQDIIHLILVIISFMVGAAYSGLVIGNTALKLGRSYSVALLSESALLLVSLLLLSNGMMAGHFFAAAACGLQNAMTTTYSGAVVRTTHVTGLFTDLGVALGLRFRGQKIDVRKFILYITLIAGFLIGGIVGALLFNRYHFSAMLVPCVLTALVAVSYWLFLQYRDLRPRAP